MCQKSLTRGVCIGSWLLAEDSEVREKPLEDTHEEENRREGNGKPRWQNVGLIRETVSMQPRHSAV